MGKRDGTIRDARATGGGERKAEGRREGRREQKSRNAGRQPRSDSGAVDELVPRAYVVEAKNKLLAKTTRYKMTD